MTNNFFLLESIFNKDYENANRIIDKSLAEIVLVKLKELKKIVAEKFDIEDLNESNVQRMGRKKRIRIRLRSKNGRPVVQRGKVLSAVKGFTVRGGTVIRMSPQEKMKRMLGARKAKIKRRAHAGKIKQKYQKTMRKRKAMGLK